MNLIKKSGIILVELLALPIILSGMVFTVSLATAAQGPKVFVCKYIGKPGVDETLKGGKNPISVSSSATVGTYFNDAQGRSYVLAIDNEQEDPDVSQCPAPQNNTCQYDATILATDSKCINLEDTCPAPKVVINEQCKDKSANPLDHEVNHTMTTPVETQETEVFSGK